MFQKKDVLENFAKFTGKQLCQGFIFIKKNFKNAFFIEPLDNCFCIAYFNTTLQEYKVRYLEVTSSCITKEDFQVFGKYIFKGNSKSLLFQLFVFGFSSVKMLLTCSYFLITDFSLAVLIKFVLIQKKGLLDIQLEITSSRNPVDRSSHTEVFLGKAVLKICSKFTEKQ